MEKYDVIIVGAGPSGLFSAYKLAGKVKVGLFELGYDIDQRKCPMNLVKTFCAKCKPCHVLHGVGGSGGMSDGKLNYANPKYPSSFTVGGDLLEYIGKEKLLEKMEEVDKIFLENGAPEKAYGIDEEKIKEILKKANSHGIEFVPLIQRHIGSDRLPRVIKNIRDYLIKNGVEIYTRKEVVDINPSDKIILTKDGEKYSYEFLILAVGRAGSVYLEKWAKKYGMRIANSEKAIDVGVRVEVPASVMEDITSVIYDPKFRIITKRHDDYLRTFCTCPYGWVIREDYQEFSLVNGHSKSNEKTNNTNFALIGHYRFTEPFKSPNEWGRYLAILTTKLGGGNPIVQRLKDLRLGRRSTPDRIKRNRLVRPTLESAVPGDISLAYPGRVIEDILDALEQLDKVIPGVADDSTLLYAPEIKFYSFKLKLNSEMETSIPDIYAIGDGAGVSRGIVGAAISGLIAAESILRKLGIRP